MEKSKPKRNLSRHKDVCILILSYLGYLEKIKFQGINRRFYNLIVPYAVDDHVHRSRFEGLYQFKQGNLQNYDLRVMNSTNWRT